MKDIIITKRRQLTELITLLVCLVAALALHVYAIIAYDGKWSELYSSIGFTIATAIILYAVWTVVRLMACLIKRIITKNKDKNNVNAS